MQKNEFEIKQLCEDDIELLKQLNAVFADAFEDQETYLGAQPDDEYLAALLCQKHVVSIVAIRNDQVIGGLFAYELPKFEQRRSEFYIYDLAVAHAARRKGIATRIIRKLQKIAKDRGGHVVFVQAEHGDCQAIALYSKLGAREEVLHFDLKPLE